MSPRPRPVDGVTIDLKPRPHASQSLLEDRRDSSVVSGSDAQQQVATAAIRSSQFSIYQMIHKSYKSYDIICNCGKKISTPTTRTHSTHLTVSARTFVKSSIDRKSASVASRRYCQSPRSSVIQFSHLWVASFPVSNSKQTNLWENTVYACAILQSYFLRSVAGESCSVILTHL